MLIDQILSKVRWEEEKLSTQALQQYLRDIAAYPYFYALLINGGLALAPDSKNRRLAALFTTLEAREALHQSLPTDGLVQYVYVTMTGLEWCQMLQGQEIDGLVFNCLGPQDAIAFRPALCERILAAIEQTTVAGTGAPEEEIDRLASHAFPNLEVGSIQAQDELWRYVLTMPKWVFAMHPKDAKQPKPFKTQMQGKSRIFAFTSTARAATFCKENNLTDPQGNTFFIEMPLPEVLSWLEENTMQIEILHFNFGGIGWFAPIENIKRIREHLGL